MQVPAISVIIPMYNAEKYIDGCLRSFFAQTFTDFELIVVDDCSTDNSVAIVENYAEKFGGRLKIIQTQKNSGGGGYVGRNFGLNLSRGEYIFFADADDFVVETALEIMHAAAVNAAADVVYIASHYLYDDGKVSVFIDSEGEAAQNNGVADKISLTIDNPDKNLRRLMFGAAFRNPWTKFVRRDFLVENEIFFPNVISGGDVIWVVHVFCCAKRLVRLPIPLYFYRTSQESISRQKNSPDKHISRWIKSFVAWSKALGDLAARNNFLHENPAYCHRLLTMHLQYCLDRCEDERKIFDSREIFDILQENLAESDKFTIPFLISVIDAQKKFRE